MTPKEEGFQTGVENFHDLSFEAKHAYWHSLSAVEWLDSLGAEDDRIIASSPYTESPHDDPEKHDLWNEGWWKGFDHGLHQWLDEEGT